MRSFAKVGFLAYCGRMARGRRPPSQTWTTFLKNHAAGIAAVDLFVVPTIGLSMIYALIVLRHDRRNLLSFGVTAHPTAEWIARQITEAFPWDNAPRYLIWDRNAAYGEVVRQRLWVMGMRDHPTAPRSPWQKAYAECLIGSIRRACLEHMIVLGADHLHRILKSYAFYYNEVRTHLSLGNDAPTGRSIQRLGVVTAFPNPGGLHHQYCRI